jgi:hypothetical protein
MPGQQGSPGWEGQKGRPEESECPKLSRKTEEGQKEEEVRRQRKTEPIDADDPPGQNPGAPKFTLMGAGDRGWVVAPGPSPATLKGSRTFGVAAGGCTRTIPTGMM